MKTSRFMRWRKLAMVTLGLPCLISCQTTPFSPSTIEQMECEVAEGASHNRRVKPCPAVLPVEVSRAMKADLLCPITRDVPLVEKQFDVNADQVPARLFFLSLVQDTPYNVNVHPSVTGNISVQLKKVTISEVLASVRNVYGFDFKRSGKTIEIFPATLQTRSFKINYLDFKRDGDSKIQVAAGGLKSNNGTTSTGSVNGVATTTSTTTDTQQGLNTKIDTNSTSDFWKELKEAVEAIVGEGEGRKVAVSPMSGLVVVQAMPNELRKVAEFLKSAQLTLNRQVILEAKILEVELNDSFQSGINWALLSGRLRATEFGGQVVKDGLDAGADFPILNNNLAASAPVKISPGRVGPDRSILPTFDSGKHVGFFGGVFTLAMNYKNLASFIELLSAQGKVHVLSSPRISTLNNQKALIKIGSDQFFITNVSTTQTAVTGGNVVPTQNVTFDSFFSGIALDVTPSINACDEVTLHVHPMVSNVKQQNLVYTLTTAGQSPQVSEVPLAKSTVRESDSVVRAKSGQMVVIGGLMQDQTQKLKEGLPILKNIPVLGNMFGHTVEKTKKSELIILLRPIVVDDQGWTDQMGDALNRVEKLDTECE